MEMCIRDRGHGGAMRAVGDFPDAAFHVVTDKIRKQSEYRHQNALVGDVKAHAVCKDTGLRISWLDVYKRQM